ncbi:ATP-grasp domain-containing protein [Pullulanibacillus sp. KACC 23026]|uniref:ATP-grasp domain-containing protein n=1 Tax=Pullulanibacillus sp. KACC 23026 TaxID=3028315 RepID=UPI0023B0DED8|nr:ATP-grasp domain-containing protein [Pullulanibacillus sp. KACC 23026]WEG14624.1 ATP-grasp domain-containing protein [Pullulanibacillus sp. KACC 23026]
MALRIWFNRWFSTVSHYIEMIRDNPDGQSFVIYGSHPNPDSVYLKYCDVAETEPDIKGESYLRYCLEFCLKHGIDLFIPRKENVLIAQHIEDFKAIGVKVLVCPDGELMNLMDDKAAMYRSIEDKQLEGKTIVPIPAYRVVNTAKDFQKAYGELKAEGNRVCIKPVVGEGASGFRIIDDSADTISFLFSTSFTQKISYETAYHILQQQETFPDLMVLEYLEGYEYSIDCLSDEKGSLQVAIPRKKGVGRIREIEDNKELLNIANQLAAEYKIPFVYNIQVKYKEGVPKLLEINPRMSGGLHISCLSGINIPYYAIRLLLDGQISPLKPVFGLKATHLEQSIIL